MARFKNFGTGRPAETEPLSFELHGEVFEARPRIQGKFLLDLSKKSSDGNSAELVTSFFENVLKKESLERFRALLVDEDKIVDVETLAEITGWLVGEYTSRPEEQPEA